MVKITGGFKGNFKKKFENTIDRIKENVIEKKVSELKSKGLYKPGITKIVVKLKDSGNKWKNAFRKR